MEGNCHTNLGGGYCCGYGVCCSYLQIVTSTLPTILQIKYMKGNHHIRLSWQADGIGTVHAVVISSREARRRDATSDTLVNSTTARSF